MVLQRGEEIGRKKIEEMQLEKEICEKRRG